MINKRVEIEFDIQSGNVFTLNDPVKGVLNSTTYTLGGVQYVDVSDYVKSFSTNRGRSRELDRYQSGSASVVFDNRLRTFDPVYADGPYAGNIIPRKKVRIWGEYITVPASTVTNYVPNPSFEVNTLSWGGSSPTRVLSTFYTGIASCRFTAPSLNSNGITTRIDVPSSQTYTASAWVRGEIGKSLTIGIRERTSLNGIVGTTTSAPVVMNDGWIRLNISRQFSSTGTKAEIIISNVFNGAHVFYVDSAMLTEGDTLYPYFDGSTTPDDEYTTYAWSSTADNSASTRTVVEHLAGDVFYGLIDDWDLTYDVNGESIASITVIDELGLFNRRTPISGVKPIMKSGERIDQVLTEVGWPLDRRRVETGQVTIQRHQVDDATTDALSYMQLMESCEQGDFFVAKNGDVVFRSRNDVPGSSDGTLVISDDGTGIPYTGIQVVYGTELLYNRALITTYYLNAIGEIIQDSVAISSSTIAIYGESRVDYSNLPIDADTAVELGYHIVNRYQNPEYRFESVEINMLGLTDEQRKQILDLELTDVLLIKFTPNSVGDPITKYAQIISIQNSGTVDRSTVRLGFRTLEFSGWLLGTEQFGRLDFITMN